MAWQNEKEPDIESQWKTWKAQPSPQASSALLDTADPIIESAARTHIGDVNPLVKAKGRRLALSAFQTYSPDRGSLKNHLYSQLQGLKRYSAKTTTPVRVPERLMLDRSLLERSGTELNDKLGRDATLDELADHTGLSVRRIAYVRSFQAPMSSGYFDSLGETAGEGGGYSPGVKSAPGQSFLHMVYGDLEPTDKKIMEWSMGLGGAQRLSNQQIADKLRLTPGAISQRKLKIQQLLNKEQNLSPFGT